MKSAETDTIQTLNYMPAGGLITTKVGTALPKFNPDSCLLELNLKGAQLARCDQIDPATKTVLASSEPDIRQKSMRLTIERDLVKNPLPAHCTQSVSAGPSAESMIIHNVICNSPAGCSSTSSVDNHSEMTIESTEDDVEQLKVILMKMKP